MNHSSGLEHATRNNSAPGSRTLTQRSDFQPFEVEQAAKWNCERLQKTLTHRDNWCEAGHYNVDMTKTLRTDVLVNRSKLTNHACDNSSGNRTWHQPSISLFSMKLSRVCFPVVVMVGEFLSRNISEPKTHLCFVCPMSFLHQWVIFGRWEGNG